MSTTSTGKVLEDFVKNSLVSLGYTHVLYKDWSKQKTNLGKYLIQHFPYKSIYNSNSRTEFVIQENSRLIRVECKWQQVSGSVDEKLPYLLLNAIENFPENEIILLVDGGGFKTGAINWLRQKTASIKIPDPNKIIKVMNMMEFQTWVNKGMKTLG